MAQLAEHNRQFAAMMRRMHEGLQQQLPHGEMQRLWADLKIDLASEISVGHRLDERRLFLRQLLLVTLQIGQRDPLI